METVARSLRAKVIDDIHIPATHVVMDMSKNQTRLPMKLDLALLFKHVYILGS